MPLISMKYHPDELLLSNLVTLPTEKEQAPNTTSPSKKKSKKYKQYETLAKYLDSLPSKFKNKRYETLAEYLDSLKTKKYCTTSDEEPKVALTQEDIHPDIFDPTKKIHDYQAFIGILESLFLNNNLLEYCAEWNRLTNQIIYLKPLEQLSTYHGLLLQKLAEENQSQKTNEYQGTKKRTFNKAEIDIISCLYKATMNTYLSYFQEYDTKRVVKKCIDTHLETYLLTEIHNQIQFLKQEKNKNENSISRLKKLKQTIFEFMSCKQDEISDQDTEEESNQCLHDDFASCPSILQTTFSNPSRVEIPLHTTCFTLENNRKKLIGVTDKNTVFEVRVKNNVQKIIQEKNTKSQSNTPYYLAEKSTPKTNAHRKHLTILKARPSSQPTYFLEAFTCYFLGRKSGKIIVTNNEEKNKIYKLIGHKDTISGLVPLEDKKGHYIASSSHDTTIKIWDFANEVYIQTLQGDIGKIESLAKTNTDLLIALSKKKFLEIWDVSNKRTSNKIKTIETVYSPILSILGHNNYCLTGLSNSMILVWDPQTGLCIQEIEVAGKLPIKKLSSNNHTIIATQETNNKKILTLFMKKNSEKNKRNPHAEEL